MSTVTSKFFQKYFKSKIALQLSAFADSHRAIILASHKFVEVKVRMTPEHRTEVQQHAQDMDESTTAFINRAIDETMARDNKKKK